MRALLSCLLLLALLPNWTVRERLPLLDSAAPQMDVRPVMLDPAHPTRRRLGALTYLGGVELTSRDPAFGGFSSLTVAGDRFTLLSDGGNAVMFAMGADWRPHGLRFVNLPSGPGVGWRKEDRDSESLAVDPVTGDMWVGFEGYNQIWRYSAGFGRALGYVAPKPMADWSANGGPESLARLPDGRFITFSEDEEVARRDWRGSAASRALSRQGLVFAGDPLIYPGRRIAYRVSPHHAISDAAALPDGSLLVLERRFRLPFRFSNRLMLVPTDAIMPGRVVSGRLLAELDAPLIHDNFEGVAVTREHGATILWLVSDDNQLFLQHSYLLKFRLDSH
ncbi:esterase-like activity of phytase family protein [Sphingomonas sp.]|uniref:esterase-like activity of phytase family protein n=1 Tax=Sphingomonas sp. TaxID=28214 RepID=UPI0031D7E07E